MLRKSGSAKPACRSSEKGERPDRPASVVKEAIQKFERLFVAYVARFGVEPEWNLAPLEQQLADLAEALRLHRPLPEVPVDPDVLI